MLLFHIITSIFAIPLLFVVDGGWVMAKIDMIKHPTEDNIKAWLALGTLGCIGTNAYVWFMLR